MQDPDEQDLSNKTDPFLERLTPRFLLRGADRLLPQVPRAAPDAGLCSSHEVASQSTTLVPRARFRASPGRCRARAVVGGRFVLVLCALLVLFPLRSIAALWVPGWHPRSREGRGLRYLC